MTEYKSDYDNKFIKYNEYLEISKKSLTSVKYTGNLYRGADFWVDYVPVDDKPVKYLEIGTYHGGNAISFALTYGKHNLSEIHCIDPWIDYEEYNEYQDKQNLNYNNFLSNVINSEISHKFHIHRGFSDIEVQKFKNEYFDIIYIDGNHDPDYVLEDGVLSFRKLKSNGYMIFDDYGWNDTSIGIDSFIKSYSKKLEVIGCINCQMIIRKK